MLRFFLSYSFDTGFPLFQSLRGTNNCSLLAFRMQLGRKNTLEVGDKEEKGGKGEVAETDQRQRPGGQVLGRRTLLKTQKTLSPGKNFIH